MGPFSAAWRGGGTELLVVIGGGPYGIATAARAKEAGIDTVVVGRPLGFWTENMPEDMFLRSGPDWHLDASGVHTFEAFLDDRGIEAADVDPLPITVFLEYAAWFQAHKGLEVRPSLVSGVRLVHDGGFEVALDDGEVLEADEVVAAPGVRYFQHVPEWAASVPAELCAHTCEMIRFEDLSGARVLVVGGRQSAYEWAALAADHGAERVDVVHRHDVPRFARVSWKFADACIDETLATPGWWRGLPPKEQDAIARRFWEVGRLTLEWWLTPRLPADRVHRRPGTTVAGVEPTSHGAALVSLSDGGELEVDRLVLATGYRADLARVPYLAPVMDRIAVTDGFPVLDEHFQSNLEGLYFPGFAATRDFGPFFGFTKGCPAAAELIVRSLLAA